MLLKDSNDGSFYKSFAAKTGKGVASAGQQLRTQRSILLAEKTMSLKTIGLSNEIGGLMLGFFLGFCIGGGAQKPCHIVCERAHYLQSFFVLEDFIRSHAMH